MIASIGIMRGASSLALWLPAAVLALAVVVYLLLALSSRRLPELQTWHTERPASEFRAHDAAGGGGLAAYLEREQRVFSELDAIVAGSSATALPLGRYRPGGRNDPSTFPANWNRSFEMRPESVRGAALLLHGLTDSPYSVRRTAEVLRDCGFSVLGLRLPGHGTTPAALTVADRRDWRAAVRIGAAHARSQAGAAGPLWIVGYSNGGALALDHALSALDDPSLPRPNRLILLSPAVGVSPFAAMARWHRPLSLLPAFEKFRWHTVFPEHDPFKYNSFPKSAAFQTHRLILELLGKLDRAIERGLLGELPPVLAFQSVADATVRTAAVVDDLFLKLGGTDSELVAFDINRVSYMQDYFAGDPGERLARLCEPAGPPFRLTLITNADRDSKAVVARRWSPNSARPVDEPLGLSWPLGVFSLSHVSVPFPPDDPVYGSGVGGIPDWGVPLGSLEPRGERDLLAVPIDLFTRLRYNPFFPYVERRLVEAVELDLGGLSANQ
jgi:alpha-beta hydrolase superfamily lysophospholipase